MKMRYNAKLLSRLGPFGALGKAAIELGDKYENLGVFTADLRNFSGLDRFAESYPDKFYNVGIAEQNLIGTAAGFASEGNIAVATTYASFASMRCLDQVSVNMAYMKLNVKLVGVASGFCTGILGATHSCINDLAIMRSLPNLVLLSPADGLEIIKAVQAAVAYEGPVYIRLTGSMDNPIVYHDDFNYSIGRAIRCCTGDDVAIIATGSMVHESIKAADLLQEKGISSSVYDMHTIKPLDSDCIKETLGSKLVVTVEEHGIIGGLGEAVIDCIDGMENSTKVLRIGVPCEYSLAASYQAMKDKYGLNAAAIADKIIFELEKRKDI